MIFLQSFNRDLVILFMKEKLFGLSIVGYQRKFLTFESVIGHRIPIQRLDIQIRSTQLLKGHLSLSMGLDLQ